MGATRALLEFVWGFRLEGLFAAGLAALARKWIAVVRGWLISMAKQDEQPDRAAVEAKLLAEAEQIVTRLEAALAAAPDDQELRAQLERIVEQARHLRARVEKAIATAREKRGE